MVKTPIVINADAPKSLLLRKRFVDIMAGMKKQAPGRFLLEADNVLASCKFPWQYKVLEQINKTDKVDELVFLAGQLGLAVVVYKGEPSFYRIGKFNDLIGELGSSVTIHEGPCSLPILLEEGRPLPTLAVGPFMDKSRDILDQLLQLGKKETDFIGETGSKLLGSIMGRAAMLGLAAFFVDGELVFAPVKAVAGVVQEKYSEGTPGPGHLRTFAKQQATAPYRTSAQETEAFGSEKKDNTLYLIDLFGECLSKHSAYKREKLVTTLVGLLKGTIDEVGFRIALCTYVGGALVLSRSLLFDSTMSFLLDLPFLLDLLAFLGWTVGKAIKGGIHGAKEADASLAALKRFYERIGIFEPAKETLPEKIARFLMEHCSKKEQTILIGQMGRFFGPGKEVKKALKALEAEVADNLATDKKRLLEMQKKQEECPPEGKKEA
jgi:hypothetical protein